MKVIFTDNIQGVAVRGEIRNIKKGFFRNFLMPRKKAVLATESNLKLWEELRKKIVIEKEQLKAQLEEIKRRTTGSAVKIEKKVTSKGTLYGGVKSSDVSSAIKSQLNLSIPESSIHMDAIKNVGTHTVRLDLGEGVNTDVTIDVVEKK